MSARRDEAQYLLKNIIRMAKCLRPDGCIRLRGEDIALLKKYYPTNQYFDDATYRINGDDISVDSVRVTGL